MLIFDVGGWLDERLADFTWSVWQQREHKQQIEYLKKQINNYECRLVASVDEFKIQQREVIRDERGRIVKHHHYWLADEEKINNLMYVVGNHCFFGPETLSPYSLYDKTDKKLLRHLGKNRFEQVQALLEQHYSQWGDNEDWLACANSSTKMAQALTLKQGKHLDILAKSQFPDIREMLAQAGEQLSVLINDEIWWIRREVVRQNYGLEKLIYDENLHVRAAVARQGFGHEKLISDKDWQVRWEVAKCTRNPEMIEKLMFDDFGIVSLAAVKRSTNVALLEKFIKSDNWQIRWHLAARNIGVDVLADDIDERVRAKVARQGFALDKLAVDKSPHVRYAVARHQSNLDKLVKDRVDWVRKEAIKQKEKLDRKALRKTKKSAL